MFPFNMVEVGISNPYYYKFSHKLKMEFKVGASDVLQIADAEIQSLLQQVYVGGGYTAPDDAAIQFDSAAVRKRGFIIGAREKTQSTLAGMIILVPPNSPARRLAQDNEAEIHLLGVRPEFRGHDLGRRLLQAAVDQAIQSRYSKLILWTQLSMGAAQKLYEAAGFVHISNMEKNGREFKVYEKCLPD